LHVRNWMYTSIQCLKGQRKILKCELIQLWAMCKHILFIKNFIRSQVVSNILSRKTNSFFPATSKVYAIKQPRMYSIFRNLFFFNCLWRTEVPIVYILLCHPSEDSLQRSAIPDGSPSKDW
jgi:multisubunit Na+/H+ antiporter MnhE subunit